ncbi:MAG TPA: hypothetical protein VHB70_06110 [Parafilimonas sp.]|nr:hypothetical protein [Parafilimonas sp.]
MRSIKKIVLISIAVVVTSAIGYAAYVWFKPQRDVTEENGIKITATALFDSFTSDEKAANISFLNKAIEVTGEVSSVKQNQAGNTVVYLQSSDPVFGINCTFKQNPGKIFKGDTIVFKGICTGYLSDVILNSGILIKGKK